MAFADTVDPAEVPATVWVQVVPEFTGTVIAPAHSSLASGVGVVIQMLKVLETVLLILT
jgi:hypothetical protein